VESLVCFREGAQGQSLLLLKREGRRGFCGRGRGGRGKRVNANWGGNPISVESWAGGGSYLNVGVKKENCGWELLLKRLGHGGRGRREASVDSKGENLGR